MNPRSERIVLGAAALLAIALPCALERIVRHRIDDRVEPALSALLGVAVSIGDVDVGLSGSVRLDHVAVGELFAADSVSAAMGLETLLSGRFGADEVRVERPRISAGVRADGTLDAAELMARVRDRRRTAGGSAAPGGRTAARGPRRIIVTGGELVLTVAGHGELRASGVELHPQEGGVRVVASGMTFAVAGRSFAVDGAFTRVGVDVALPELHVGRAALAGGRIAVKGDGGPALALEQAVVTRGIERSGETRIEARVAGGGAPVALRITREPTRTEVELTAQDLPLAPLAAALASLTGRWPTAVRADHATMTGRVTAGWDRAAGELFADGDVSVRGLGVAHRFLASEPLPIDGAFRFDGGWSASDREARLHVNAVTGELSWTAEVDLGFDRTGTLTHARLTADVPETTCGRVLAGVPLPLRTRLDGLVLDGTFKAHAELGFDRRDVAQPTSLFDVDLGVGCRVLADASAADPTLLNGRYLHRLPGGGERIMAAGEPGFVAIADLPAHVVGAFVAGEDARFFRHDGFDPEQVRRSFEINVAAGRVERGGSTISQQLIKNLWLSRDRTLGRKLLEAVLTWRVEQTVSKQRMLEVYLNLIELGEGVHGIGPAAQRWFGKPAAKLSVAEAAFLAALTPAPVSTDRRLSANGAMDPITDRRVKAVLRSMVINRVIDRDTYRRALAAQLNLSYVAKGPQPLDNPTLARNLR